MIEKSPGWSHSLRLIELFPDHFLNFIHRELRSNNIKVVLFFNQHGTENIFLQPWTHRGLILVCFESSNQNLLELF
jgi:hypothetical protein